jgi:hypothetical protein
VALPYTAYLVGVQKILDSLLSWPAVVGYGAIALGGGAIFAWVDDSLGRIKQAEWRAEQARERAIRERERREAAKEDAERSRADFDFLGELERALGKRREE